MSQRVFSVVRLNEARVVWYSDIFYHLVCLSGASEGTISMQEGEVLAVVEEDKGDGWTRVRRNNGDEGYIPTSYVTISLNKWQTHEEQEKKKWSLHQTVCSSSNGTNHKEATALWAGPLAYPEGDPNKVLWFLERCPRWAEEWSWQYVPHGLHYFIVIPIT